MRRMALAITILLFLFDLPVKSADIKQPTDQEKLFQIAQTLQISKPLPFEKKKKGEEAFCRDFLKDLKERRGIEFIEPIVKTDDYNDPNLQSYLGKCPNLQVNKSVSFEPRLYDYAMTLPEDQRDKLGHVWLNTLDFRLYHVDIDNNPNNGKEFIYYGSGSYNPKKPNSYASYTDYKILTLEKCIIKSTMQVGETINYITKKPTENINGILKYKNEYYAYDALSFKNNPNHSFLIFLKKWETKGKATRSVCTFKEVTYPKEVKNDYKTNKNK